MTINAHFSDPLRFPSGHTMKNRFMLAPLTNLQSHEDGHLSDEEFRWLSMRAQGGFGVVMTCASHVQALGKGFPGQLGIFSDGLLPGHQRLTANLRSLGSLSVIQIFHAGMRSPKDLIGQAPVCPSDNEKYGARALSLDEVQQLRDDFIAAAVRAQRGGYDGVEVHGAHGYIICQFLSAEINQRKDAYGGPLENRARLLYEVVEGIRDACGPRFLLGVRLSPERFGMDIAEVKTVCRELIAGGEIDFLDLSLWDSFKNPEDSKYGGKDLLGHFLELEYGKVRLTVAGKIRSGADVRKVMEAGVDFVTVGRSAILHHDFPARVIEDADFEPVAKPVPEAHLRAEGLSEKFVNYMRRWKGFVKDEH